MIGVTGAPGSGKTEVAREFAALGASVVALDALGHELLRDARVREEIRAAFGDGVFGPDGAVSREALGRLVFDDAAGLARLDAIVHPRIVARVRAELEEFRRGRPRGPRALVIEGALLVEMGLAPLCDRIVLVTAPREVRERRLRESRGWGPDELARRERWQLDDGSRRASGARVVLENASERSALERQVKELWEEWTWEKRKSR